MIWKKLSETENLPPVDNGKTFLLARGIEDTGGPVYATARRVRYGGDEYIRYLRLDGWTILPEDEYPDSAWTEITYP